MCGIAGIISTDHRDVIRPMTRVMGHRGPDGEGYFEDDSIALGHRPLMAKTGAKDVGFDVSTEMLKCAEQRAPDISSISFQAGDAHNLPFEDKSFDYVMLFRALMQFDKWDQILGQLCRV